VQMLPDDDHRDYGSDPALAALRAEFPALWVIRYEAPLRIYSAELRSGGGAALHYLCGHDVDELRARLVTATAIDAAARR
jgi:hypothetical protein